MERRRCITVTIDAVAVATVRSGPVGHALDAHTGEPLALVRFTQNFGWKIEPLPRKGERSRRYYLSLTEACKARGWNPCSQRSPLANCAPKAG